MPNPSAAYGAIFGLHFRSTLVKRVDHLAGIATGVLLAYALAFLWRALYENRFVPVEVSIEHMMTYAILGSVLSTAFQTDIVFTASWRIRTGDVIIDLLRPLRWQLTIMAEYFGISVAQLLVLALPVVLVSAIFLDFQPPASVLAGVLFVPSLVMGVVINFGIVYLVLLLAFQFTEVGGFEFAVRGLRPLLTGAFVPLWVFPDAAAAVLRESPFPSIYFAPLSIYVGAAEGIEVWEALARQAGWSVFLAGLGAFLTYRIMCRLVVQVG